MNLHVGSGDYRSLLNLGSSDYGSQFCLESIEPNTPVYQFKTWTLIKKNYTKIGSEGDVALEEDGKNAKQKG